MGLQVKSPCIMSLDIGENMSLAFYNSFSWVHKSLANILCAHVWESLWVCNYWTWVVTQTIASVFFSLLLSFVLLWVFCSLFRCSSAAVSSLSFNKLPKQYHKNSVCLGTKKTDTRKISHSCLLWHPQGYNSLLCICVFGGLGVYIADFVHSWFLCLLSPARCFLSDSPQLSTSRPDTMGVIPQKTEASKTGQEILKSKSLLNLWRVFHTREKR